MEKELENDLEEWGKKALGLRPYSNRMMDLKTLVANWACDQGALEKGPDDFKIDVDRKAMKTSAEQFCKEWTVDHVRAEALEDLLEIFDTFVVHDCEIEEIYGCS